MMYSSGGGGVPELVRPMVVVAPLERPNPQKSNFLTIQQTSGFISPNGPRGALGGPKMDGTDWLFLDGWQHWSFSINK